MKGVKKFFIYLLIIVGILVVLFLSILAVMYFSPNTPILGFEYVHQSRKETKTYSSSSELSIQNIQSVEIYTGNTDIYIFPNSNSGEIKIVEACDFSGFAKEVNGKLSVKEKVENRQYEENNLNLKTLVYELNEPTGWISKNKSRIEVYISNDLNLNTIFAKATGGDVYYKSNLDESVLRCNNLFLKTGGSGKVGIVNTQNVNNYYLKTQSGSVDFGKIDSLTANQIKFTTDKGSLIISNLAKTCTVNSAVVIESNNKKSGPYVCIDKLNGALDVSSNRGTFEIGEIGSYGNYKVVSLTINKSTVNFGTVYGNVSILSSKVESNVVHIKKLYYVGQVNTFITGAGNLTIDDLNGKVAVETTSGNVKIAKATETSDVCVYTKSGDVNVNYNYSEANNKDNSLKVITHTGNINLNNVSCYLEIKVLSNSANSACNIAFTAVSTLENKIDAKNRKVNLYFINTSDYLRCRIVSKTVANIMGTAIGSEINPTDDDVILDEYEGFDYSYRVNYNKDDATTYIPATYTQMGRLIITSTQQIYLYAKTVV